MEPMRKTGSSSSEFDPLTLIRDRDLADRWQKSLRTLQRWRSEGYGPAYLRIGGTVFYRLSDVLAFEANVRRGGGAR
jgi:hypothetical protein